MPIASPVRSESVARSTAPQTQNIRVAFCIDNMSVGGTELNALRTAHHLLRAGVDLRVFTISNESGPLADRYADLQVPVHRLPLKKLYGRNAIARGREMTDIIRRHAVQIVHAHDFYSNIFAALPARLAGAAFIASRRWWEGPDRRTQRWANRGAYLFANRVLANSASVGEFLVRKELVRRKRIVIVPNFLDEEAFDLPPAGWVDSLARDLQLPQDRLVVGVVASLSPIKDHSTLLRAVAPLTAVWSSLHVVLVGRDAGSRTVLENLGAELGIADRVHFAGARPGYPSPHHLFDISVLTSISEGLPNTILEAMACRRPVVATAVGAVRDAVKNDDNGFLVDARDVVTLTNRLHMLLSDGALRNRMGERGRYRARNEYTATAAIDRLLATYHLLAGSEHVRRI
jgi:glycosyltransferase involved in cell wall biosynthesis